jgi:hypothetical protein
MNKNYTCKLKFKDNNIPDLIQIEKTESLAISTINHWSKQFAGISSMCFFTPENDCICFGRNANYVFTIPAENCKTLELKA